MMLGKHPHVRKMKVMEMEFTVLGEISPAQKDKCIMFSVYSLGENSMKGQKG